MAAGEQLGSAWLTIDSGCYTGHNSEVFSVCCRSFSGASPELDRSLAAPDIGLKNQNNQALRLIQKMQGLNGFHR